MLIGFWHNILLLISMIETQLDSAIPPQDEGGMSDTVASRAFDDERTAQNAFSLLLQRFIAVEQWHQYAGWGTADFILTDGNGVPINRNVQEGDHFRINIPAPGNTEGDGYDWVKVEKILHAEEENGEGYLIRVRPANNPQDPETEVSHFFSDEATSSFIIRRIGNTIYAEVHGRNEHANTDEVGFIDKARNAIVALFAKTAFSKFQWKSLVDGLLDFETSE